MLDGNTPVSLTLPLTQWEAVFGVQGENERVRKARRKFLWPDIPSYHRDSALSRASVIAQLAEEVKKCRVSP